MRPVRHRESNSYPSDGREEISAERLHLNLFGTLRLSRGDQPVASHPQMVLLSGEASIGKTLLAEELCSWVARQGVAVVHCYPAGGDAVAYALVRCQSASIDYRFCSQI
jgi:hypothetical protein